MLETPTAALLPDPPVAKRFIAGGAGANNGGRAGGSARAGTPGNLYAPQHRSKPTRSRKIYIEGADLTGSVVIYLYQQRHKNAQER